MARTTPNGYIVPEDGEAGNTWADALEFDIDKVDALETTVDNLSLSDINRTKQTIVSANWAVDADGKGYKQAVTVPTGITLDNSGMRFRVTSGPKLNRFIQPSILPLSLTNFEIVVNDPTLDLEILYL